MAFFFSYFTWHSLSDQERLRFWRIIKWGMICRGFVIKLYHHEPLVFPFCLEALCISLMAAIKNVIFRFLCCLHRNLDAKDWASLALKITAHTYYHSVSMTASPAFQGGLQTLMRNCFTIHLPFLLNIKETSEISTTVLYTELYQTVWRWAWIATIQEELYPTYNGCSVN